MLDEAIREKIDQRIRKVKYYDDQWKKDDFGELAHYTTWKKTVAMLKEGKPCFRLYNLETANDPLEGRATPEEWQLVARTFGDVRRRDDPITCNAYGICFAGGKAVGDSLVWWRLYGDDGKGCCIKVPAAGMEMYRVRYRRPEAERTSAERDEDEWVAEELRKLLEAREYAIARLDDEHKQTIREMLMDVVKHVYEGYSYLVKDVAYSDEREWRQLIVQPREESIRYDDEQSIVRRYVEGPLLEHLLASKSEIAVGPRVANGHVVEAYLKKLVADAGLANTSVRTSRMPYRVAGDGK